MGCAEVPAAREKAASRCQQGAFHLSRKDAFRVYLCILFSSRRVQDRVVVFARASGQVVLMFAYFLSSSACRATYLKCLGGEWAGNQKRVTQSHVGLCPRRLLKGPNRFHGSMGVNLNGELLQACLADKQPLRITRILFFGGNMNPLANLETHP